MSSMTQAIMCVVDGAAVSIACDASARVHARSSPRVEQPHRHCAEQHGARLTTASRALARLDSCMVADARAFANDPSRPVAACLSRACQHRVSPHRTHTHTGTHPGSHTPALGTNLDRHGALSIRSHENSAQSCTFFTCVGQLIALRRLLARPGSTTRACT